MEYCVAIRTLGTAGDKYQTLLDSLNRQTIRPKKILVYIPDGYAIPKETIGWEEYIRSLKGMITQRSLPFDEVDTDYILFCDDDLWLADDFVERLYKGLKEHKGDCISPDIYKVHKYSFLGKIKKAIAGYAFPRRNDGWAFKIMRNGGYSYNYKPSADVLLSESAAGACMLIKKSAYQAIHFDDERWLENYGFALGEDLLFFYKLFTYNYRLLIHSSVGINHLDAGTGSKNLPKDWIRKNVALALITSYRIGYDVKTVSVFDKILWFVSNTVRHTEQYLFTFVRSLMKERRLVFFDYMKGIVDAYRYVHSEAYRNVPKFDAYL